MIKGDKVVIGASMDAPVVLEIWATWCPPCRASIPHLTELAHKYNKVKFVGVTTEPVSTASGFVSQMGSKMDYYVAADTGHEVQALMQARGVRGIPHAFILDVNGNVVWQGHPIHST
eukprot:GABW01001121.1.p1 GENE.GABW01001121.1~~GABW01001121.1.p1  ORF type:complete len:126 (-),score=21.47 GABW01001121.1:3-353(-)